jgi:hypothetical protein
MYMMNSRNSDNNSGGSSDSQRRQAGKRVILNGDDATNQSKVIMDLGCRPTNLTKRLTSLEIPMPNINSWRWHSIKNCMLPGAFRSNQRPIDRERWIEVELKSILAAIVSIVGCSNAGCHVWEDWRTRRGGRQVSRLYPTCRKGQ